MSLGNSGAGGVRNLRAMFENKGGENSTSPPSRGRSPAASDVSIPSRPVSKVRTSFVAVERPGDLGGQQWGLRKASDVSSMAEVKEEALQEQRNASQINGSASKPLNGTANGTSGVNGVQSGKTEGDATAAGKENSNNLEKDRDGDTKADADPKKKATATGTPAPSKSKASEVHKPAKINAVHDSKPRTAKVSPTKPTASSAPRTPKTPTTPTASKTAAKGSPKKPTAVVESATRSPKATAKPEAARPKAPRISATGGTSASMAKTFAAKQPSPNAKDHTKTGAAKAEGGTVTTGGFVKPRPRSPTKPVRLPASATAQTASSAAKTGAAAPGRSPSRAATTTTSLARKPSTLKRDKAPPTVSSNLNKKTSRASLSGAPQSKTHEQPKSRVSTGTTTKPADSSFLARMMRPTNSSASKVQDDVKHKPESRRENGGNRAVPNAASAAASKKVASLGEKADHAAKKAVGKNTAALEPVSHKDGAAEPEHTEEAKANEPQADIAERAEPEVEHVDHEPDTAVHEGLVEAEPAPKPEPEPELTEPEPEAVAEAQPGAQREPDDETTPEPEAEPEHATEQEPAMEEPEAEGDPELQQEQKAQSVSEQVPEAEEEVEAPGSVTENEHMPSISSKAEPARESSPKPTSTASVATAAQDNESEIPADTPPEADSATSAPAPEIEKSTPEPDEEKSVPAPNAAVEAPSQVEHEEPSKAEEAKAAPPTDLLETEPEPAAPAPAEAHTHEEPAKPVSRSESKPDPEQSQDEPEPAKEPELIKDEDFMPVDLDAVYAAKLKELKDMKDKDQENNKTNTEEAGDQEDDIDKKNQKTKEEEKPIEKKEEQEEGETATATA